MMNTKGFRLYNENDIEINADGISIDGTFFNKKEIADMFNELILTNNFIENQC